MSDILMTTKVNFDEIENLYKKYYTLSHHYFESVRSFH